MWLYADKVEKQKFLLWQENKYKFSKYLLYVFVILLINLIFPAIVILILQVLMKTKEHSAKLEEVLHMLKGNNLLLLFAAVTAGITEELLFRGYLQPRLEMLFKNAFAAILVSAALFASIHIGYGTVKNIVGPFCIGIVFATFYWKYKNIKVLIFCHFFWDLALLYVSTHYHLPK
ncbi:CPBP family intramembrane glutamic endopeptidase [Ferruginibacter albus]|uniref:CPBP family intramembrane glutamic endopeptidase n=1 Tax=Ferruginibacter albus TaxID=2875540 RepID=UPI001CC5B2F8|nr:CPBP family intramembrane glutamic endopeptidase [Ferruginibacter albus]UAY51822.1 CPBP family intramembrane metalloprotease [Ferruginibacter albus]